MFVISIFFGIMLGCASAYAIVNFFIMKSNVSGNSKGDFRDFTETPLVILEAQDKVKENMIL